MLVVAGKNFRQIYSMLASALPKAPVVMTGTWQGIPTRPEMATHELEDVIFEFDVSAIDLDYWRAQIGPNHPWADDHFEKDRVSGEPLNPGLTWQQWPYALKADSFRNEEGQFNHTYAERYWPKYANQTFSGVLDGESIAEPNRGIRYDYGDLNDVIDLLHRDPFTRAAYLPVFFPEDTGIVHRDRVPCTLGYLFRMREGRLSISYDIRSCDFVRHFRDDVYLTLRLLLWVLDQLRDRDPKWKEVSPGRFLMHVGSMHLFVNDARNLQ